jgi:hypothetical protein
MNTPGDEGDRYGAEGEARLRAFVETCTGGRIVRMERQVRWRPAWFVDVERDGSLLHLHLRGDRAGNVNIFPDLKREADVIDVLSQHGIQVPRIHGYCVDPPCIVMDAIPGSRVVAEAESDAQRSDIARQYIAQVVAMHRVPTEPFVARGVHRPEGAKAIALVGLEAYLPHYRRTKSRPEPLLEFVIGWLRRNVPTHRTKASFIQFDCGQFLFENGRVTGLYDFEFSMIGDPMVDLATMRMRDNYEPLGERLPVVLAQYEALSGEPVDRAVIEFHTLQFSTLGTMQFTGTVGRPTPGDPHAVYLMFDLALRQVILQSMSALTGFALQAPPVLTSSSSPNAALIAKLSDTLAGITPADELARSQQDAAEQLIEWWAREDAHGAALRAADVADIAALLDRPFDDWDAAQAALEAHVLQAGPEEDARLYAVFAAQEGRRLQVFGPTRIGRPAEHVHLPPLS